MEALGNTLSELVKYLQEIAPEVWAILLKQQIVDGWSNIAWAVILFISLLFLIPLIKKLKKGFDNEEYSVDQEPWAWGVAGTVSVGIIQLILIPIFLSLGIRILINPEYYAIMELISNFK